MVTHRHAFLIVRSARFEDELKLRQLGEMAVADRRIAQAWETWLCDKADHLQPPAQRLRGKGVSLLARVAEELEVLFL
jgi:hypothetical protein